MAASSPTEPHYPALTSVQRMRLYGPSLITLIVLLPFFTYYFRKTKDAQSYLNDRAFRILDIISHQFGSEITGVASTMDAAYKLPEQLSLRQKSKVLSPRALWLAGKQAPFAEVAKAEISDYLKEYVLDGESTVKVQPDSKNASPNASPNQAGMTAVCAMPAPESRDLPNSSNSTLCISVSHTGNSGLHVRLLEERHVNARGNIHLGITIDTRLDSDRMLKRALSAGSGSLFESVFVASRSGQVLAESRSSKLNVRDLEAILAGRRVRTAVEGGQNPPEAPSHESADPAGLPREVWGADQRFDVQVSGTSYVLFVAPASFVLDDESSKESSKETPIAFYGLTPKDDIDAEAQRLPPLGVPVIFISLIVLMAFLWPALKLYTMSDRDRLTKFAVAAMSGVALLAGALLGALYLSYGFYLDTLERNDEQLHSLSDHVRKHFTREIVAATRTADSIVKDLSESKPVTERRWPEDGYHLLSSPLRTDWNAYPFLTHVVLLGAIPEREPVSDQDLNEPVDQRQIIKFSATGIPTPLIPMPVEKFPFIGRLLQGEYATLPPSPSVYPSYPSDAKSEPRHFVIQSIVSPNTGEFLPSLVFNWKNTDGASLSVLATTELPSLVNVLFPNGFGFAVVDKDGLVQFHSEASRNLNENFFGETAQADELKATLRREESKHLWLRYGGREVRAYVRPLGCRMPAENDNCISDLGLGLIVFVVMDAQRERLSSVGSDLLVYFLGLPLLVSALIFLAIGLKRALWPATTIASVRRRIWPCHVEKPFYLLNAGWGLFCFIVAAAAALVSLGFKTWAVFLPAVLFMVLAISLFGFDRLRRLRKRHRLPNYRWMKLFESRIPLSTAYAGGICGTGLALGGIFFLLMFQLAVSSAQLRIEDENYRSLAAAMKVRKDRYLTDYNKYFGPGVLSQFEEFDANRQANGGYDVYDGAAIQQNEICRLSQWAPVLNFFSFFDQARKITSLDFCRDPKAPKQLAFELGQIPVWNALPSFSTGHFLNFYLPGLLLLLSIFLWMHMIVRRVFILDFREPDLLPALDEETCRGKMLDALRHGKDRPLDRILIFAHPRSGTGLALERIVEFLKKEPGVGGDLNIVDFGKVSGGESRDASGLPAAGPASKVAILDNFEVRLCEAQDRTARLTLLEGLVYSHKPSVYVFTSVDPLLLIESLVHARPSAESLQSELNRWTRLLGNFERFVFQDTSAATGLDFLCGYLRLAPDEYRDILDAELRPTLFLQACASRLDLNKLVFTGARHFEDSLVRQVRNLADGYYRVIWLNCTSDERLALYQLAKDHWLNPLNEVAISHLLQKQLICRHGAYRLMNVSFGRFVLDAVTVGELSLWKRQQNFSLWPALRMALILALFLIVLFVSYVWRSVFDVYLSYLVALTGGLGALLRFVTQLFSKDGTPASLAGAGVAGAGVAGAGEAKTGSEST